jgi:hypothetical protein
MTDVFRYVHVYRPVPSALVFMASDEPIDLLESAPRALENVPADFGRYGIHRVEDFFASWALDTEGVRKLAKGRPPNTDDHNFLATTRLPPAMASVNRSRFDENFSRFDVLTLERLLSVRPVSVIRRMAWNGEGRRALQLAKTLPKAKSTSAQAWLAYDGGRTGRAQMLFGKALDLDPDESSARAGLITMFAEDRLDPERLDEVERLILRSNALVEANDWANLRELDDGLAEIPPGSLLFANATRARVQWRISIGTPADGVEAIALVDELMSRQRTPMHVLLRASAGAAANDPKIAWAALEDVASATSLPQRRRIQALALARRLGEPPKGSMVIQRLSRGTRPGS